MLFEPPDRPLPAVAILGLLVEGHDVARVAAAFDVNCATIRGIALQASVDVLSRYRGTLGLEGSVMTEGSVPNYNGAMQCVKNIVSSDIVNVLALLTIRERMELLETFVYYRAFCNSPVHTNGVSKCLNTTSS